MKNLNALFLVSVAFICNSSAIQMSACKNMQACFVLLVHCMAELLFRYSTNAEKHLDF